jgi:peptide chain release factor 2
MYTRWAERRGFACDVIHRRPQPGSPQVTLHIRGTFAFGWLRGETGVHRLIRPGLSPLTAESVLVRVLPDIEDLALPGWNESDVQAETIPHLDGDGRS